MARSWQYPRWRRYAMQATMWLILGATVGLAALVNHERRRSTRVELGSAVAEGWLVVRLPKTWERAPQDRDPRVVARAVEPDEQGLGRTVTITRDRLTKPISPLEYLLFGGNQLLGLDLEQAQHAAAKKELVEPILIGDWPGVLVRGTRSSLRGAAPGAVPHKEVYAATVLPSGHAIVVKLEGDRPAELSDVEIVKQLAGAIEVGAQPTLGQSGETIALEGGIRLAVPESFRPVYETDDLLLRRRLWPDGDVTRWQAAELVPCLFAPPDGSDETIFIKALAAVHDPALRDATVTPDGPRRWRIIPPGTAGPFAVRAYLIADELGDAGAISGGPRRALMAFFHATPAAEGQESAADAAWAALSRSVSFVGKTSFAALFDAGAAEVTRLRTQGLAKLLGSAADDQWWIWSDTIEKKHVGWTHFNWRLATATLETPNVTRSGFRGHDGRSTRVRTAWTGELRKYNAYHTVFPPTAGESIMRQTIMDGSRIAINLVSSGRPIAQGSGNVPPQFLPGASLPLFIEKLSDKPMILQSDAYLDRDAIGAPTPLMLLVEPVTEKPALTAPDGSLLRCLSIRVNGGSEATRWYVRESGEVDHVALAGGMRLAPSDSNTVIFTFDPEVTAPW
ncbi:MAG: hypothetical protein WBD40_14790 [Tepidisphaeraceae bacterium]